MSKSNNIALVAYHAVNSKDKVELKEVVRTFNEFHEYLTGLCRVICKKGLKDRFVYQWIFSNYVGYKDIENYCKANLFAAKSSLKRIISNIEKEGINKVKQRMLTDFICDLKFFITRFDSEQDYSWLVVNTNSHITNFYHKLAKNIFGKGIPSKNHEERLVLATSTPFIIRQSIEYKIKRILGIDYYLVNGKPDTRSFDRFFKAIRNNLVYYQTKDLDFNVIKKIHSWTHSYVHGGYRPEPWRTETALNYLEKLFYSGKTTQVNSYSLYAGIEVNESDLEIIKSNTEKIIKRGIKGEVKINWRFDPEVAII